MNQINAVGLDTPHILQTLNQRPNQTILRLQLHLLALGSTDERPLLRRLLHEHTPHPFALGFDNGSAVLVPIAGVHERLDDVALLASVEHAPAWDVAVHVEYSLAHDLSWAGD